MALSRWIFLHRETKAMWEEGEQDQQLNNFTNSIICLSMMVISYFIIEAGLPASTPSCFSPPAAAAAALTAPMVEAFLVRSVM